MTFPAMHMLLGRWTPSQERTILASVIYSSCYLGTVIAQPVTGWLCDSSFLLGWPSSFYIFGITGTVTSILFAIFVYESPEAHPTISNEERAYIQDHLRWGLGIQSQKGQIAVGTQSMLRKPLLAGESDHHPASESLAPSPPDVEEQSEGFPLLRAKVSRPVPWRAILSTPCVWGLVLAHTCHNYGLCKCLGSYQPWQQALTERVSSSWCQS